MASVRATRQTVLPLWADHLGLSPSTTSVVFGLAGLVDTLTFYPSGKVMDRAGRLWIAVPSILVLGLTQALLPLTQGLVSLTVVAMLMGFGNGIGSGIMGAVGVAAALALIRWVPRYSPFATTGTRDRVRAEPAGETGVRRT